MLYVSLLIIGFLISSGIMALIDAAILSVTPAEAESMRLQNLYGARRLVLLKSNITRTVSIIVIMTNIINILGPILIGAYVLKLFGSPVLGAITIILTIGTIIFSEIIPKSLGTAYAPIISRLVAPMLYFVSFITIPVLVPLNWLTRRLYSTRTIGTEHQITSLVHLGVLAGHIGQSEYDLIQKIFTLNDTVVKNVMVPLANVVVIKNHTTVAQAAAIIKNDPHSRFPVINKAGKPIGMLLARDVLLAAQADATVKKLTSIIRPCIQIESHTSIDALLHLFKDKKTHLALVKENNKTIGIITLEDVLEELVGEIEDEMGAK